MDESRGLTVTSPERVPLNSSTSSSSGGRRPVAYRAPNQPSYGQNQQSQNDSVSGSCCGEAPSRKSCVLISILLVLFILLTLLLAALLIFGFNPKTLSFSSACSSVECIEAAGAVIGAMDLSVDPCDDFYKYACGGFELRQSIPAGQNKLTQFAVADNIIQKKLRAILETPGPKGEIYSRKKVRRYYKSCMDRKAITENGVNSLKTMTKEMGGLYLTPDSTVPEGWSVNRMMKNRNAFTLSGLFKFSIGPDDMNVLQNVIQLDQGGLGLGDDTRDYYIEPDLENVLSAYIKMLRSFAEVIEGPENVNIDEISKVIELEKRIAEAQNSKAEQRDIMSVYTKVNISWLQQNAGFMDWHQYLNDLFTPVGASIPKNLSLVLYAVPYFKKLHTVVTNYTKSPGGMKTLQNYMVFQSIIEYAPRFGDEFKTAFNEFMSEFVGKRGSQESWQICVADTDATVGYPLGALYVEKYFSPSDRDKANLVMSEVIRSFKLRIEQVSWMDEGTKSKALEKIEALNYGVGYPDWLTNDTYMEDRYEKLVITDDYTANQFTTFAFSNNRLLSKLQEGPDKRQWQMTPQTVNAYYEPTQNKFVVPAGIWNIPFFFAADDVPQALNFGAIGSVTGHEITHGFDDQGCQYDKFGNLVNWWNNATLDEFKSRTQCLEKQYSNYEIDGMNIRGNQTLGENIADNGGVKTSYQAFKHAVAMGQVDMNSKLIGLDLNADQLFFVGYAQAWCSIFTPEAMKHQVSQNEHSPGPVRVMGPLSNSPEFAEAFKCKAGSPMNPENKCSVW